MAWAGYFCKIGNDKFPNDLIANAGLSSAPNQQTDQDSYVDANGLLHRNILTHLRSSFKITTYELTLSQKISIAPFYSTTNRKKVHMTYWNDEINDYSVGDFYIPTVDFSIDRIEDSGPVYSGITLEFIEY